MSDTQLSAAATAVVQSAIARTRDYFGSEYGIDVIEIESRNGDLSSLPQLDMTAIIGLGGLVNLLVAFSFQKSLVDAMYAKMNKGFDVPENEVAMYREATVGEVVNTILGHCTMDLQKLDRRGISMTPPFIINHVKMIRCTKSTMFYTQMLNTPLGYINISLGVSKERLDNTLKFT